MNEQRRPSVWAAPLWAVCTSPSGRHIPLGLPHCAAGLGGCGWYQCGTCGAKIMRRPAPLPAES